MALTEAEKTELKKDILNAIKAESRGVDELAEVTSLDNIKSLPAMRGQEVVLAPVSLLKKPAEDAAATAKAAAATANNAASAANTAAGNAASAAGSRMPLRTPRMLPPPMRVQRPRRPFR